MTDKNVVYKNNNRYIGNKFMIIYSLEVKKIGYL